MFGRWRWSFGKEEVRWVNGGGRLVQEKIGILVNAGTRLGKGAFERVRSKVRGSGGEE